MSAISVLFEELTFHKYKRKRDVLRLLGVSFLEPFLYPILSFFAIKANIQYLKGNKGWGKVHKNGSINGTV
jgi:hypothetical protein